MEAPREDIKAKLDKMLTMPEVKAGKAFGAPAYKLGRKVFCFVGSEGIAIKLTPERVKELVDSNDAMSVYSPQEGQVWNAWVEIDRANADDYEQDMPLFKESIKIVSAG